ncbi:MAG: class I SAM-dependent methyltransferase [Polyangiaceae bacterium]
MRKRPAAADAPPAPIASLDDGELRQASASTIAHYDQSAESFWQGTKDHDVSQNVEALLRHIESESPFVILDIGCGPGRDLKTFCDLGHAPLASMVARASFRWRANTRGYRCFTRIFSRSI